MKATWNGTTLAEAPQEDLIQIEGNWYFPPTAVRGEYCAENDTHTQCSWKGTASYYDVTVSGETNHGAAWYYPEPMKGSVEQVGVDFANYVAFWRGVEVA